MATSLLFGLLAGAFGMAYIVYGKRQSKFVPLLAGIALCGYTYFIDSWVWLCIVGAVLLAAPFIIDG
jgi:hypothetical protein